MRYEIKCFLKPHPDYNYDNCEDRLAINPSAARFAVADGMTESYLSHLFAELLVNDYINEKNVKTEQISILTNENIGHKWKESVHFVENSVEGTVYETRLKRKKRLCDYAASTFAGISIHGDTFDYLVIGDSCLFVLDKDYKLRFVFPDVVENGFNNHPSCITSEGEIKGDFLSGTLPIQPGYIFLSTDAISKWFLEHISDQDSSGKRIWGLSSHEEMFDYFQSEYELGHLRGDDVAIIAIHVIEEPKFDVLCYDTIAESTKSNLSELTLQVDSVSNSVIDDGEIDDNHIINEEVIANLDIRDKAKEITEKQPISENTISSTSPRDFNENGGVEEDDSYPTIISDVDNKSTYDEDVVDMMTTKIMNVEDNSEEFHNYMDGQKSNNEKADLRNCGSDNDIHQSIKDSESDNSSNTEDKLKIGEEIQESSSIIERIIKIFSNSL